MLLTNEKTVDLHVEELTNDYTHMSNAEIITLQLNHFHKELDKAILNHYYRIIFIHGKGNGILRGRIRSELDAMKLKYRDADTNRFGFGATEVLL
jgi:dsDNA-specific endonuclease/ATPase MutS2